LKKAENKGGARLGKRTSASVGVDVWGKSEREKVGVERRERSTPKVPQRSTQRKTGGAACSSFTNGKRATGATEKKLRAPKATPCGGEENGTEWEEDLMRRKTSDASARAPLGL